jgi:hypothetical protein
MSWGVATQNGVSVGLASIVSISCGATEFSPASLFTSGVVGAWYDPSDYSSLFQDSAGTTAVTAVEQPVGLMLDKSQGLVLGSEQVISPLSTSGVGWSVVSNTFVATSSTATGVVNTTGSLSTAKRYQISFTASALSGGTCFVQNDSSVAALSKRIASAGNYTFILVGSGTAALQFQPYEGTAFSVTISNISVKEIAGNHASQATSASRPILRARYNLLTYSEQFDNAAWLKQATTVTANSVAAPDGTTTADKMLETATTSQHSVYVATAAITGTRYTMSVYGKAAERRYLSLHLNNYSAGASFDLQTGTVVGTPVTAGGATTSIVDAGNGWYRCSVSGTSGGTATYNNQIGVGLTGTLDSNVSANESYAGNATSGIYIWGADLRTGSSAGTYQRIAAATDYDTVGFLPYLAADGVDDNMVIPVAAISGATAITELHGAWRPTGFASSNGTVFGNTGAATIDDHEPFSDNVLYYGFASTSRQNFGSLGTVTTPYILDATQTGTTLAAFKNNAQLSTTKTVALGIGTTPRLFMSNIATGYFYAGNLFGGVLIQKVLSASEMTSLRNYMAAKSGVTL